MYRSKTGIEPESIYGWSRVTFQSTGMSVNPFIQELFDSVVAAYGEYRDHVTDYATLDKLRKALRSRAPEIRDILMDELRKHPLYSVSCLKEFNGPRE